VAPGYVVSIVIAGLSLVGTFVAAFVLVMVGLIGGASDTDRYGRVPIPGRGTLELPAGTVSVFYEVPGNSKVSAPPGLGYSVTPSGGGPPLETRPGGGGERVTEGGTTRVGYSKVEVEAAGSYAVASSLQGGASPGAALAFGDSLGGEILDQLKKALWGLAGLALAAVVALATLARRSLIGRDEQVTLPPEDERA
jgi:hypothetical protein